MAKSSRANRNTDRKGGTCASIVLLMCLSLIVSFQRVPAQDREPEEIRFELKRIRFEGNESVSDRALRSVMTTKESPSKLSIFLFEHISERLGSQRQYFDPATFEQDLANLRAYYRDQGFFSTKIDTVSEVDSAKREVDLKLIFQEGPQSLIDSVRYHGLETLDPVIRDEILADATLKIGSPFNARNLQREQQRVLNLFYNRGFSEATLDSTTVLLRLSTNNVVVVFWITPRRQFRVREISIVPIETKPEEIDQNVVMRYLDMSPGQLYSLERKLRSERNLSRLGIFETVKVDARFPSAEDTTRTIPVSIFLKARNKHELTPEVFVNDVNNAFNLGLGLGYNNRNFFGSARNFSARSQFRVQSIQRISFFKMFTATGFRQPSLVAGAELTLQLLQPYLFTNKVSGTWSFSLIADKQRPYLQSIIRNRVGVSTQFAEQTFGLFDWSLERMSVEIFDSASARQFVGEQRPQLNSIFVATWQRDVTNDVFSPSAGWFASISAEEAGMVPALFKNFGSNLPFSQYYKLSAYGRLYKDLSKDRFTILALKLKAGFAESYRFQRKAEQGDLPIPINRRFFAGGSGSVRGWRTRELGAVDRPQFGGNAILESTLETRINILKGVQDWWVFKPSGVWTVFFFDIGNIWGKPGNVRFDQLAVASGFGIRYDTIFGPVRVDFGFRVYDPGEKEGRRWFSSKRFWSETFSTGVLHFGIGHAF